jgi:hypothetical protein
MRSASNPLLPFRAERHGRQDMSARGEQGAIAKACQPAESVAQARRHVILSGARHERSRRISGRPGPEILRSFLPRIDMQERSSLAAHRMAPVLRPGEARTEGFPHHGCLPGLSKK